MPQCKRIFCSYAHENEADKNCLLAHLSVLETSGAVSIWHSRQMRAGDEVDPTIEEQLQEADLILLLVTSAFLRSEYIRNIEMPLAMKRRANSARVIPIIVRHADWRSEPYGKLLALPGDGHPVYSAAFKEADEGWLAVVEGIRAAIDEQPVNPDAETRPEFTFDALLRACTETSRQEIKARIGGKYNRGLYVSRRREEKWLQERLRDDSKVRLIAESSRRTIETPCQDRLREHLSSLRTCLAHSSNVLLDLRTAIAKAYIEKGGEEAIGETESRETRAATQAASWTTKAQSTAWKAELLQASELMRQPRDASRETANAICDDVELTSRTVEAICEDMSRRLMEHVRVAPKEELNVQLRKVQDITRQAKSNTLDARQIQQDYSKLRHASESIYAGLRELQSKVPPNGPECRDLLRRLADETESTAALLQERKRTPLHDAAVTFRRAASWVAVIIDKAGGGKTNLLCRFTELLCERGLPVLFVSGKTPIRGEADLLWRVILGRTGFTSKWDKEAHLSRLDALLSERGQLLYVIVDGINEANDVTEMSKALSYALEQLAGHRFFFFISCRDIYWSFFAKASWHARFVEERLEGGMYEFTEEEVDEAVPKYKSHFHLDVQIGRSAREQLRHPLLLRFFCEAYGDVDGFTRKLPVVEEIRLKPIFDQYWNEKLKGRDTEDLVRKLAEGMFRRSVASLDINELAPNFTRADATSLRSTYNRLRDEHVIVREERHSQVLGGTDQTVVSFVYEPFMEYAIARWLYDDLCERIRESGDQQTYLANIFEVLELGALSFLNTIAVGELLGAFLLDLDDRFELAAEFIFWLAAAQERWLEARTVANIIERNDRALPMLFSEACTRRALRGEGSVHMLLKACSRGGSHVLLEVCASIGVRLLVPEVMSIDILMNACRRLLSSPSDKLKEEETRIQREFEIEAGRARQEQVGAPASLYADVRSEQTRSVRIALSELAHWLIEEHLLSQPAAAGRWRALPWKHNAGLEAWEMTRGEARPSLLREIVDAVAERALQRKDPILAYAANGLLDQQANMRDMLRGRIELLGRVALLLPKYRP